jgi:hypothetical protein
MNTFNEPIFMENKKLFRQGAVLVTQKRGHASCEREKCGPGEHLQLSTS